ncbi:ABC transporter ATP-binding protein [Neorhizobium galegae]|uniref:Oligopeptide/dipeptide ABC transporter, ATPase subunit n=1 Tax=Neorhizobium galegae bv. orientalis str. HAMBI 540 TaxID=1028800 RepID=A0A068T1E7_NEOGA|nr:ABC transporter ATP-binding protein [Neorhizobium galegae]MCQ1851944.1 ABC transporter ATP-binding protein [Neorhizobium galegae]CDN52248.1 Oligopeptide/dipeptide ABC transporter, ATPase subunit [Neorhizobium galegae bv. orientalis str. HAMBI 540]
MAPLLQVDNLTIRFPRAEPVRNLSFEIEQGETLAIVGESGSGKSLTALALMQLLPRAAKIANGRITFGGRDLTKLDARQMRHLRGREIAMIFQEPMTSLNPVMTIGRQIGEVLKVHEKLSGKAARARAIELLRLVRIPAPEKRVDDYPHQLSGGMRQRVMIAIAVACKPKLLIADEPTTALDVTIQAQVLDLLDTLRRELRMAVVLITHDLGVVAQWADKVVVMYAGRKVEQALPGDLFNDPLHPYTRGLLAASPRLKHDFHYRDGALTEIPGSIVSAVGEAGCPFRPRCNQARASCGHHVPQLIVPAADRLVACPFTTSIKAVPHAAAFSL